MSTLDLTPFHLTALSQFLKQNLTEKGLARSLKCDTAVARHAISVLKSASLIVANGSYQFGISQDGILKLRGEPGDLRQMEKPPADPVKATVQRMASSEVVEITAVLDSGPIVETAADAQSGWVVLDEPVAVNVTESPKTDPQPSFAELVRRGLDRLNKQLQHPPLAIENKRQKLEMLTSLADTLDGFDRNLSASLRQVATDINMLPEAAHG